MMISQALVQPLANLEPTVADGAAGGDEAMWANRRQHKRYPTNWPAFCEVPGGGGWPVVIINASEGGFGLSSDLPVDVGSELAISVADVGTFPCVLVWKRDGKCGVRLTRAAESFSDDQVADLASGLASLSTAAAPPK